METKNALTGLEKIIAEILAQVTDIEEHTFYYKKNNEKWSVAEEMHHLTLCTFPINNLLSKPGLAIEKYGSSGRASRNVATFTANYYDATQGLPWRSFAPFIPKTENEPAGYVALHETINTDKAAQFYQLTGDKMVQLREKVPMPAAGGKQEIISQFTVQHTTFINTIKNATEQQLDEIQMPLPYMGLVTLREMLFFTLSHTGHHAGTIKKLVENTARVNMV